MEPFPSKDKVCIFREIPLLELGACSPEISVLWARECHFLRFSGEQLINRHNFEYLLNTETSLQAKDEHSIRWISENIKE